MLRALPDAHAVALFREMPHLHCSQAVSLPQDILTKWVTSQTTVIDLRDAKLFSQCAHVVRSIAAAPLQGITSLHVPTHARKSLSSHGAPTCGCMRGGEVSTGAAVIRSMKHFCNSASERMVTCTCSRSNFTFWSRPSLLTVGFQSKSGCFSCVPENAPVMIIHPHRGKRVQPLDDVKELISYADALDSNKICPGCRKESTDHQSLIVLGGACDRCKRFWGWHGAPVISPSLLKTTCAPENVKATVAPTPLSSVTFAEQVLVSLETAAAQMTRLTSLGLYNLPLNMRTIRALGHVFHNMPPTFTTLTLSTQDDAGSTVGSAEQLMLFKAIALMRSLRSLVLPQWSTVVGHDASNSTEPLCSLPKLDHIVVGVPLSRIETELSVFPQAFKFVPN